MPVPRRRGAGRRRRREAVLGASPAPRGGSADDDRPLRVLTGIVLDASPHLLVLHAEGREQRLPLTPATKVWRGGPGGLAALRPGREAIVREAADGLGADRIWVDVRRVSGTILTRGRDTVEVDMGPHRGRVHVLLPPQALGRVLVRHPRLEPGYLFDAICVRSPGGPQAVRPGTSQPGYRADDLAAPPPTAPVPDALHGTATWFDAGQDAEEARSGWGTRGGAESRIGGAAYPAVDAEDEAGGCADAPAGCVPLPFLSLGSELAVRNECTGRTGVVPVVECGCAAALFCDRCVECGTSPRGRVVELTPAAFVGLGGELEAGCFNTVVRHGAPDEDGLGR
ncbi:hypothetical protein [Spirillospora sp. NBC_01491]|uniref:hypothetical protein n=1 Tax=Spirillospora sp. NBC_01491 TaxID=2976007 RepID=UPI002E37D6CF|nr:hypothetical protein [Spirillospora sp. NBC_01491]